MIFYQDLWGYTNLTQLNQSLWYGGIVDKIKEITDSINSIAVRVNQTGKIYPEDMQEIYRGVKEISIVVADVNHDKR